MNPPGATRREVTRVAVGVLLRADGAVLLADRPAGKPYAGYWEFPGGKVEPGEQVAAALERELHEELGIDIGPSVPWVTFQFDYPHAYVELQFRLVYQWRGEPHARECQKLRFVEPAGQLPQPLLPAAVPVLRWLLLPRVALVIALSQLPELAGLPRVGRDAAASRRTRIVVMDGDWQGGGHGSVGATTRRAVGRGDLPLASGLGSPQAVGADGVVFEASALSSAAAYTRGWRGAWVDSEEDLRIALRGHGDFVLVRSAALAEKLSVAPAALPAFLPAGTHFEESNSDAVSGQGHWIDLRSAVKLSSASFASE